MQEAREYQKIAQREAKRAIATCQQARRASSDVELMPLVRSAATAANDAINAAKNAKSRYELLNDEVDTNICFQDDAVRDNGSITIESVCLKADLAEFGADMAATAVMGGGDTYNELKEAAAECSSLVSSQDALSGAKILLTGIKRNQKIARNAAKNARTQCQLAARASSGTELMSYLQQADDLVSKVFDATERAESGCRSLDDISRQRSLCNTQKAPATGVSEEAVCQRSVAAAVASDLARTMHKNANEAFMQVRERALTCDVLGSGQGWITRAKEMVSQSKDAMKQARKESKTASAQCRKARNAASDSDLRKYLLAASSASTAAMNAAETAKSRYTILRNERDRDVCTQGRQAVGTTLTADTVCQHADVASFGADLALAALSKGNEALVSVRETAMSCESLQAGQEQVLAASELMKGIKQYRQFASNGAKQAKKECQKARNAATFSEIEQLLQKAKKIADDSMIAAEQAQSRYYQMEEIPITSICGEDDSDDIKVTFEDKEPEPPAYYTGGTQERQTSLRLWLYRLANMLAEKIPPKLIDEYGDKPKPDGCALEGFKVEIGIDAFERIGEGSYWIQDRRDCVRLPTL